MLMVRSKIGGGRAAMPRQWEEISTMRHILGALGALAFLIGCAGVASAQAPAPPAAPPAAPAAPAPATAPAAPAGPTASGNFMDSAGKAVGKVSMAQDTAAVVIRIEMTGVPAGWHGLHIHAVGKCDGPDFTTAGGHYNPGIRKHGARAADGAHVGDLPNVFAGADGRVTAEIVARGVNLGGPPNHLFDEDGSALVLHATEDDHRTDPTGNSGGRIACAVLAK
jgi:superoxide dismutase, Cu-Zn family